MILPPHLWQSDKSTILHHSTELLRIILVAVVTLIPENFARCQVSDTIHYSVKISFSCVLRQMPMVESLCTTYSILCNSFPAINMKTLNLSEQQDKNNNQGDEGP